MLKRKNLNERMADISKLTLQNHEPLIAVVRTGTAATALGARTPVHSPAASVSGCSWLWADNGTTPILDQNTHKRKHVLSVRPLVTSTPATASSTTNGTMCDAGRVEHSRSRVRPDIIQVQPDRHRRLETHDPL